MEISLKSRTTSTHRGNKLQAAVERSSSFSC